MGNNLKNIHMKLLILLIIAIFPLFCAAQEVKKDRFRSTVKLEEIISGHLQELNGKYKIRITETTYEPGGFMGEHHSVGPGIRYVKSGELTYVQNDTTRVYREGTYFYESGDVVYTAYNRGEKAVTIINFEVVPADWKGASPIPVPKSN
jgi:quercetin dioxygenase-like cupin family protein